jgi:hypothetical protein
MVLPVVGQVSSLVGCSSPLHVLWGFATRLGLGATHIVVGTTQEKVVVGDVVHF